MFNQCSVCFCLFRLYQRSTCFRLNLTSTSSKRCILSFETLPSQPRYTPAGFSCKVGMKQTRVLKLSLASGLRSFESAAAGRDSRLVDNRRAVASTGRSTTSKRIARADGRLFQMLIDDVIRRSRPSQRRSCVASGRASLARPRVELATLGWALFARSLACRE